MLSRFRSELLNLYLGFSFLISGYSQASEDLWTIEMLKVKCPEISGKEMEFSITSQYFDSRTGIRHLYLQQLYRGFPIENSTASFHFNEKDICIHSDHTFKVHPASCTVKSGNRIPMATQLKEILATRMKNANFRIVGTTTGRAASIEYVRFGIVELPLDELQIRNSFYYEESHSLLLPSYSIFWKRHETNEWLYIIADAISGKVLEETNQVLNCNFDGCQFERKSRFQVVEGKAAIVSNACYRVFPVPIESPIHGSRQLVYAPWTKASNASPFGWHNDGFSFYYSTKGNNVDSFEDSDDDDLPNGGDAARAYGGASLNFDFPYNPSATPLQNKDASITNLFYWTNLMHDVWYQYGFTENSGNFQNFNNNKGGIGNDYLIAQGIDNLYYARNNANFATPVDGYSPILQLYVWRQDVKDTLLIESPLSIAGPYVNVHTPISPQIYAPISRPLVQVMDASSYPGYACSALTNGSMLNGNIALVDKGICSFSSKVSKIQSAGAVAMIICNNDDNEPMGIGGWSYGIGIPAVMLRKKDCERIKLSLQNGVMATLLPTSTLKFKVNQKSFVFSRAPYVNYFPNLQTDIVQVFDGGSDPLDGCDLIQNGFALNGKIALIQEGNCEPSYKALQAQNYGAAAVIICKQGAGYPDSIPYGNYGQSVQIPILEISASDCQTIRLQLPAKGTLINSVPPLMDGDFDAGIVCHEYGHGISNRLTGGPGNVSCLNNAEQMGEGWSDFFGLVMTLNTGDDPYKNRGIGVFSAGQQVNGVGLRPYPYNVSLSVNPADYSQLSDIVRISQPHGIGYVWCSMIWDMLWAFVKVYGLDPDIYNVNSGKGNTRACRLLIEGMKLQTCSPGFVDARDAILKADSLLYNSQHACLIWNVFARRGLGFSASQGSSLRRDDGIAAHDLPNNCSYMSEQELFGQTFLSSSEIQINAFPLDSGIRINWNLDPEYGDKTLKLYRKSDAAEHLLLNVEPNHSSNGFFLDSYVQPGVHYAYQLRAFSNSMEYKNSKWVTAKINANHSNWRVYPNPAYDKLFLTNDRMPKEEISIQLHNSELKFIESGNLGFLSQGPIQVNCSDLPGGQYYLIIKAGSSTELVKFIKY